MAQDMNICIITQRYPYKNNMEFVFVKKLVDEWAKMGHRCVVITDFSWTTYLRKRIEFKPKHYRDEVVPGVFVDVYNPRLITTKLLLGDFSLDLWLASNVIGRQISRLDIKFDFIYCHFFNSSYKVFRYSKKNNIPLFVATGESNLIQLGALKKPYPSFSKGDYKQYISGVISVSSKNMNEAAELGLVEKDKCMVFPNGTDLSVFRKMDKKECRASLNFPNNVCIISCVGFFCERKGQNRLLEAVKRLGKKDIKIIYLGKAAMLDSFILDGDEIIFKGTVENKDLPTFLCASDFFCLPTRAEGCCNAVIEALACGLPVVSSNLPFNWDVLDETNSLMVDPNDIDEISSAINKLYTDKELCNCLSAGALKKAYGLSLHNRSESILNYIEAKIF